MTERCVDFVMREKHWADSRRPLATPLLVMAACELKMRLFLILHCKRYHTQFHSDNKLIDWLILLTAAFISNNFAFYWNFSQYFLGFLASVAKWWFFREWNVNSWHTMKICYFPLLFTRVVVLFPIQAKPWWIKGVWKEAESVHRQLIFRIVPPPF